MPHFPSSQFQEPFSAGSVPTVFNHNVLGPSENISINEKTSHNEMPRVVQREAWIQKGTFSIVGGKQILYIVGKNKKVQVVEIYLVKILMKRRKREKVYKTSNEN